MHPGFAECGTQVVDDEVGFFHGGEVAATVDSVLGPVGGVGPVRGPFDDPGQLPHR